MSTLSLPIIAAFAFTIVGQAIGLSLIPATRGFTAIWPTIACILSFVLSFGVFARLVNKGVQLSLLTAIVTVTLQLVVVVVGIIVYHQPASLTKIALLLGAAVIVAVASQV